MYQKGVDSTSHVSWWPCRLTGNVISCTEATSMVNSFLSDVTVHHNKWRVFDWFLKS